MIERRFPGDLGLPGCEYAVKWLGETPTAPEQPGGAWSVAHERVSVTWGAGVMVPAGKAGCMAPMIATTMSAMVTTSPFISFPPIRTYHQVLTHVEVVSGGHVCTHGIQDAASSRANGLLPEPVHRHFSFMGLKYKPVGVPPGSSLLGYDKGLV